MKGKLSSATRYSGGETYTTKVLGYDELGRQLAQQVIVPASEGELGGSYLFRTTYNPDGSVRSRTMPPAGGLPGEAAVYDYDDLGNVTTLSGNDHIITDTVYSKVGDLVQREFHRKVLGADKTWQTFDFDEKTDRLSMVSVVPEIGEGSLSTKTYAYDDTGNLLRINDEPTDPQRASDVQCFDYDHLRRLTQCGHPTPPGRSPAQPNPQRTTWVERPRTGTPTPTTRPATASRRSNAHRVADRPCVRTRLLRTHLKSHQHAWPGACSR